MWQRDILGEDVPYAQDIPAAPSTAPGVEEADPIVGKRRVSLEGLGFEKINKLQNDLNSARGRLEAQMKTDPSLQTPERLQELRRLSESASDMARLAVKIGQVQGKKWEPGAPAGHALLPSKAPTYPQVETAARTIEQYQQTGEVASPEEIAKMKTDIEQGLLAGNETQRKQLETNVGKKGIKKLEKLRTQAIRADASANAAAIEKTGRPLTDEARANPRASGLPSYVIIAMETARQKTEKFNAELAQAATLSFQRLAAGHRKLKGRRGEVKTLRPRVPPRGEQITSVEQLIQQPGEERARLPGRGRGRGRGRGLSAMQKRVRNFYKNKIHKDSQASRKKEGFIGWDTFIVYANPSMAEYQILNDAIIGTDKKRPTPKQKEAAEETKAVLRDRYDKKVGTAKTGQLDLVKRQQIKTTAKLKTDNNKFTNKMKGDIAKAKRDKAGAEDIKRLEHAYKVRLEKIKHNHKVLPYYTDKYLQDKFGEVKKLRKEKGGTQVDVPDIPADEPTGEGPAPKADKKLAAAVSAVEGAILPKSNESRSAYIERVGLKFKIVAAMQTDAARAETRRLKGLMNTNMPNK